MERDSLRKRVREGGMKFKVREAHGRCNSIRAKGTRNLRSTVLFAETLAFRYPIKTKLTSGNCVGKLVTMQPGLHASRSGSLKFSRSLGVSLSG